MEVIHGNCVLNIIPEQVCRLCLLPASDLHSIFASLIVDGYIVSLADMILRTVDITVTASNSLLPDKICSDCQKQIVTFYIFKQKTKRTNETLLSIITPNQNSANLIDQESMIINDANIIVEDTLDMDMEMIDVDVFDSDNFLEDNIKETYKEQNREVSNFSPKNYVEIPVLDNKIEKITNQTIENKLLMTQGKNDVLQNKTILRHHDTNSKRKLANTSSLKNIRRRKEKEVLKISSTNNVVESIHAILNFFDFFPCHDCFLVFLSQDNLNEHNRKFHPQMQLDQIEKSQSVRNDDQQFVSETGKLYSCGECNKSYRTIIELKYHVKIHSNSFECPIEECNCKYNQMKRLCAHFFQKHHNKKHLICLHCNKAFPTFDDLQSHVKNSCPEKRYECWECHKKFYSMKALTAHLKLSRGKKFECKTCGKMFQQQGELTIHIRSHTNERPFKCTICDKAYKTSSMRASHMDSHINGKTFECKICNKMLQSRVTYRIHMNRHTKEKVHECSVCSKLFYSRYQMKAHQLRKHKDMDAANIRDDDLNLLNDDEFAKIVDDEDIMNFFIKFSK